MTTDCIVPTGSLPNVLTVSYDENPGADLGLGNGSTIDFEAIRGNWLYEPDAHRWDVDAYFGR